MSQQYYPEVISCEILTLPQNSGCRVDRVESKFGETEFEELDAEFHR